VCKSGVDNNDPVDWTKPFYNHQPNGSDIDLIVFYVVLKFDEKLFLQLENDFVKNQVRSG